MNEMTPLQKLDKLLDEIIADPTRRPKKKSPKTYTGKMYDLPKGTRIEGDTVVVPGSDAGTEWLVTPADWKCTCPAFVRWPPCKHVKAVRKLVTV